MSFEETRIEAELKAIAQALDYRLFGWSITEGLVDTADGHTRSAQDPIELMTAVDELPENTVMSAQGLSSVPGRRQPGAGAQSQRELAGRQDQGPGAGHCRLPAGVAAGTGAGVCGGAVCAAGQDATGGGAGQHCRVSQAAEAGGGRAGALAGRGLRADLHRG